MAKCRICGDEKSGYILNNKMVCIKCDELTFDTEIELDDEAPALPQKKKELPKNTPTITKK